MVSILVVDDELQFLELTRMFLEKGRGITVYTATSGDMALEMLKERKYDAIISDYAMPGMNGIDFMKHVRAMGDDTPFIIFTGRGREDVVIDALNFGADLYVEKGSDPGSQFSEILSRIKQLVTNRTFSANEKMLCARCTSLLNIFPGMAYYRSLEEGDRMMFASKGALDLTGFTPSDLGPGGKIRYRDLVHPADRTRVEKEREELAERDGRFMIEYRIITASGQEKTVIEEGGAVCGEKGTPTAICGFITEKTV
jgi:DNA-binding response OmpR family regulator